ncbi:hypothetical protein [Geoglobus acetivorans]|uniref:Uncharacterized protein n=1 Tax=Geoglobus acetivorans TaxID=565033 RepID=A0A0A7GDN7_GEOAI|nr:hypothetical protein GACE_0901 [Geoglobus acetivorans]
MIIVFLPIPLTKPRKWMNIKVRYLEHRWFDDFGEFYTYLLKNAVIEEIVDEEELVWRITRDLIREEISPVDALAIREFISSVYGIAEEYIDLILEKVRHELILYESELKKMDEEFEEEELDIETIREIMFEVQRMYLEMNMDRGTVVKEISLTYGLSEEKASEVVGWVESYIFS